MPNLFDALPPDLEPLRASSDLVFHRLFTRPANEALLRDLLEAVLVLPSPIASLEVLERALFVVHVDDKAGAVDVRVRLANGDVVIVEMQLYVDESLGERLLTYGARSFAHGLKRGEPHGAAPTVHLIVFLGRNHLLGPKLVKRFLFREETSGEVLSSRLAVHAVEMVRFAELAPEHEAMRTRLGLWIRFFLARGRATLEAIAAESAIMSDATKALVDLSRERDLQQTMADREYMVLWREAYDARKARETAETLAAALAAADEAKAALAAAEAMNASAKEAAAAVARDEALSERLARARASLRLLLRVKFGSIGDAQDQALANATLDELDALTARVEQAPTLEAVFAGP